MKKKYWLAVAGLVAGAAALGVADVSVRSSARTPAPAKDAVLAAAQPVLAGWLTDPDSAAAIAASSGKDLLMEFDAPDGAADSAASNPAALESPSFLQAAGESFVLVRLRSSADAPADAAARVAAWGERLGVSRLPMAVLLDSHGRPYAETAWDASGPEAAFSRLRALERIKQQRDAEFTAAGNCAPGERARHLDAGLKCIGRFASGPAYVDIMREIARSDGANESGLKSKYSSTVSGIDADAAIQSEVYPLIDRGDLRGAIARIDQLLAETNASPDQRQLLLAFKGQLFFSLHDPTAAKNAFDDAMRIDPHSEAAAKVAAARQQVMGGA